MNATVYPLSRRKSIAEYDAILNKRKEQQAQKAAIEEERRARIKNEMKAESQKNISNLCNEVQKIYMMMVKDGQELERSQVKLEKELPRKMKEAELFYATADEIYPHKSMDESLLRKMRLRCFAYYLLPILDCFFAYFALYPIVTSKIANLSPMLSGTAEIIGVFFSIAVGLGVSLISRLGVSSLEESDDWDIMKWIRIVAIIGSVFALPSMYIISEVAFNGGEQWAYSGTFAFVSFTIQLLIVSGYKRQIEAMSYFHERKENESISGIKETDENSLRKEIDTIKNSTQNIISSFNQEYVRFTENFTKLAEASDEHIHRFGKAAKLYLSQMIIYFGDLVCFNNDVIPLLYHEKGSVSRIPFADFPHIYGCRAVLALNDYRKLDYIMQMAQTGISLSETIQEIESYRREASTSVSENTNEQGPCLQVSRSDIENDDEKYVSNADYEQPYYCEGEDDDDCYKEDNNQNEIDESSSKNSIYDLFVRFVNKMLEEED